MSKAAEFAEFCLVWFITIGMAMIVASIFIVAGQWVYTFAVERHYKHKAHLSHIIAGEYPCCKKPNKHGCGGSE